MHGRNRDPNDNHPSYENDERGHERWNEPQVGSLGDNGAGDPGVPVDVDPEPEPDPTRASGTKPDPEE